MRHVHTTALFLAYACITNCTAIEATDSAAQLPDGIRLIETSAGSNDGASIAYRKFELDNGLTIILHEDRSDPIAHVDVTYHVGSGREEIGKSGFAHFFEHMMFQGSENVADEEHIKIVSEAGGSFNGSTSLDRTNYYQTVPSNQLEKILWLEADRMGFLLDAVTQEKFEVQRETVKNEREQNYDNRPYGLLQERVGEALYPEGHPYSWAPIGYIEDLNRVDVNDLKAFFLRWYGPNNAALSIGGDIDEAQTLLWVKKYFGSIPRGPEVAEPEVLPVSLDADRYISMEDKVQTPMLYMRWPTAPHAYHPDEAPLAFLADIISQGKTSLLYKNLVKTERAVQIGGGSVCYEIHCHFSLYALPGATHETDLDDLMKVIRDTFREFDERGVVTDDLLRVKANKRAAQFFATESVGGKTARLAHFETLIDDPGYFEKDLARYDRVTADDIMRVYRTYLKDRPGVIMRIVPEGRTGVFAQADTWERYERRLPDYRAANTDDLQPRVAIDDFDRSIIPDSGPAPRVTLPPTWRATFANGARLFGSENTETPVTTITIWLEGGHQFDPVDKAGLASLTAALLNEKTKKSTAEALSNRLSKLGSTVSIFATDTLTAIRIRTLTENLDETIEIAAEKLFQPEFSTEDFTRRKNELIEKIKQSNKEASTLTDLASRQLLFGEGAPLQYRSIGSVDTVSSISLADVKQFYADHYSSSLMKILVISNLPAPELTAHLAPFKNWKTKPAPAAAAPAIKDVGGGAIYLIDKPGAPQSSVKIIANAPPFDAAGAFYRLVLTNFHFGGHFNSRLNANLREDKGYTYGVYSGFIGEKDYSSFDIRASVRRNATAASITEILAELEKFSTGGIDADELSFMQKAINQREALNYETSRARLRYLSTLAKHGLEDGFVEDQQTVLANMTEAEIGELAAKFFRVDDIAIIITGDKDRILSDLEALGRPIIELDQSGRPVVQ